MFIPPSGLPAKRHGRVPGAVPRGGRAAEARHRPSIRTSTARPRTSSPSSNAPAGPPAAAFGEGGKPAARLRWGVVRGGRGRPRPSPPRPCRRRRRCARSTKTVWGRPPRPSGRHPRAFAPKRSCAPPAMPHAATPAPDAPPPPSPARAAPASARSSSASPDTPSSGATSVTVSATREGP